LCGALPPLTLNAALFRALERLCFASSCHACERFPVRIWVGRAAIVKFPCIWSMGMELAVRSQGLGFGTSLLFLLLHTEGKALSLSKDGAMTVSDRLVALAALSSLLSW